MAAIGINAKIMLETPQPWIYKPPCPMGPLEEWQSG